jgi:hypothetical protein
MLAFTLGSYSATVTVPAVFVFICSLPRLSRVCRSGRNRQCSRFTSKTACKLSPAFIPRKNTPPRFFFCHRYFWKELFHFYQECKNVTSLQITLINVFNFHIIVNMATVRKCELVCNNRSLKRQTLIFSFSSLLHKETGIYCDRVILSVVTALFLVIIE